MTLCIAHYKFGLVSETFISDHIRSIAPGKTVLLCRDGLGAEKYGCPVLLDVDPWRPPKSSRERIINAVRHRWRRYVDPSLWTRDYLRVRSFFEAHHTERVLAEFGP